MPFAPGGGLGKGVVVGGEGRAPTVAPKLIVGLGNEIAGDDGIGIHAAETLRDRLRDDPSIEVLALPWAGLALLDALQGRVRVAIVDCLISGSRPPGSIVRLDGLDLAGSVRLISFHDVDFPTVMALGTRMGFDMPDEVAIWGIEAERFGVFHEELSPRVAAAIEPLALELIAYITRPIGAES